MPNFEKVQQVAMTPLSPAEWREALRQCVHSRSLHVLREQVVLVLVEPRAVFHPLHALLPLTNGRKQQQQSAFVAVMRLHENVTALLRQLQTQNPSRSSTDDDIGRAVLESLVFVDRAVDAVSAKRARDAGSGEQAASSVPFFCRKQVNVGGGALCAFAADEASAKVALSDITIAIQLHTDDEEGLDDGDDSDPLIVVVEHDEGYIGHVFGGQLVSGVIRVKKVPFKPSAVSFDSVLEGYEADFQDQLELNGVTDQSQQLAVNVRAGFGIPTHQPRSLTPSAPQGASVSATLLSSWSGIENIRSLYCKPPPNSSSIVCIGGVSTTSDGDSSLRCGSSSRLPHSHLDRASEPFPAQVRRTIAFLSNLESSIRDSTVEWPRDTQLISDSDEDVFDDQGSLLSRFRRFLSDPDASQEDTIDLNSTMELSIALNFEREDELVKSRTDLDFLEKLWEFVLANAVSAEAAATLVQELLVAFAAARAIPLVHPANPTRLGEFLKSRADADSEAQQSLHAQLSIPHEALQSLFELGEWKLQRDIASWLAQIGFTAAESALIIEQFQDEERADQSESHLPQHLAIQHLADVCALACSLGMSGSLLRKLANDCLGYFSRQTSHTAGSSTPVFVLPLNSFIPERIRANLEDAMFWDLEISFGDLMERTVRVCESSFHHKCHPFSSNDDDKEMQAEDRLPPAFTLALDAKTVNQLHHHLPETTLVHPAVLSFVQSAEKNREESLPAPTGLVVYECTKRKLTYCSA